MTEQHDKIIDDFTSAIEKIGFENFCDLSSSVQFFNPQKDTSLHDAFTFSVAGLTVGGLSIMSENIRFKMVENLQNKFTASHPKKVWALLFGIDFETIMNRVVNAEWYTKLYAISDPQAKYASLAAKSALAHKDKEMENEFWQLFFRFMPTQNVLLEYQPFIPINKRENFTLHLNMAQNTDRTRVPDYLKEYVIPHYPIFHTSMEQELVSLDKQYSYEIRTTLPDAPPIVPDDLMPDLRQAPSDVETLIAVSRNILLSDPGKSESELYITSVFDEENDPLKAPILFARAEFLSNLEKDNFIRHAYHYYKQTAYLQLNAGNIAARQTDIILYAKQKWTELGIKHQDIDLKNIQKRTQILKAMV